MLTMQPLVSVCVITYNHEHYIRQCLEGIVMQKTDFQFEIIIGEDCSTDDTRSIVKEYESRFPGLIHAVYLPKNVGWARNGYEYCFPLLRGRYIAICEGDDYWTDPYKLQKQFDFLEKNAEYVLCFHPVRKVDDENTLLATDPFSSTPVFYNSLEILHISIPTLSVMFRKCLQTIPKELFQVQSGDVFLFALLSGYGSAADLGFIGASYRKHPRGIFSGLRPIEQYKQAIKTRKVMKRCDAFSPEQKKEITKEITMRKKRYLKHFLKNNEFVNSLKIILT